MKEIKKNQRRSKYNAFDDDNDKVILEQCKIFKMDEDSATRERPQFSFSQETALPMFSTRPSSAFINIDAWMVYEFIDCAVLIAVFVVFSRQWEKRIVCFKKLEGWLLFVNSTVLLFKLNGVSLPSAHGLFRFQGEAFVLFFKFAVIFFFRDMLGLKQF